MGWFFFDVAAGGFILLLLPFFCSLLLLSLLLLFLRGSPPICKPNEHMRDGFRKGPYVLGLCCQDEVCPPHLQTQCTSASGVLKRPIWVLFWLGA